MLLYGADQAVSRWVAERMPYQEKVDFDGCPAIGVVRNGGLIAGVVYSEYRGDDILMSIASTSPLWASKENLHYLFAYPFIQLGTRRVTAATQKRRKDVRRFLERTGFKMEGVLREAIDGKDVCLYGMLKRECKWLEY